MKRTEQFAHCIIWIYRKLYFKLVCIFSNLILQRSGPKERGWWGCCRWST